MQRARDCQSPARSIYADASVLEVARRMRDEEVGSLVVVDGEDNPVGIVTDRDLLRRVIAAERPYDTTTAADVMSQPLYTADADEPLDKLVQAMSSHGVRRLAVLDRHELTGVVSLDDLLLEFGAELSSLAGATRRGMRAAQTRRVAHRVEDLAGELVEQAERLGREAKAKLGDAVEETWKRLRSRRSGDENPPKER
jgi:signal-transduction protein with cAMP-binding, CBS, and nucleotidyltransferase domain